MTGTDTNFVQHCPLVPDTDSSDPGPSLPATTLVINEKDMYLVPKLSLIGKGKRRSSDKEPTPDEIYCQVSLDTTITSVTNLL